MKWRVAKAKVMFLRKLILKDKDNICRRAEINETILGAEGLAHKCKTITDEIGLPDLRYNPVTRGEIKRVIQGVLKKRSD